MTKRKSKKILVRIVSHMCDNVSFITIRDGLVFYATAAETPLALSNLAGNNAVILRHELERCTTGAEAVRWIKAYSQNKMVEEIV